MEVGQAAAYFFNLYLRTGDSTVLTGLTMPYNSKGYKVFWRKLYLYNKNQPENFKLRIHGVDFERTELLTLLIRLQVPSVEIPKYLQATFQDLTLLHPNRTINHCPHSKSHLKMVSK